MSTAAGEGYVRPASLARTYDAQTYADAWDVVRDYHAVLDYHARNPDRGSTAIATALELPRGRVRSWLDGSVPDPVRGIQSAAEYGWLDAEPNSKRFRGLSALVAWVFSGGSIDSQWFTPRFVVDRDGNRACIDRAFDAVGLDYDFVRSTSTHRATEYRAVENGAILGRVLTTLGAPVGSKNETSRIELPAYLDEAPIIVRREFIEIYLGNRGQRSTRRATITFREDRSAAYLDSLADVIRSLTGERVRVSEKNVVVSAAAAGIIDDWPSVLAD